MINGLGKGLNINIVATSDYCGDWMSFCCWYSLNKFLPDSTIFITKNHSKDAHWNWLRRVKLLPYKGLHPVLHVPQETVAVREMDSLVDFFNSSEELFLNENAVCDVKEEKYLPFTSYKSSCGSFVLSEWINKECPFSIADNFMTHLATSNEIQVLKLWKQAANSYATLSRS